MNLAVWLRESARTAPEAPALLSGTAVVADYAAFARRAAAFGRHLAEERGIAPGDRVGLFMTNRTRFLEILFGVWWAGAAAVPINAKLHPREAAWILADAGARLAVFSADVGGGLAALADALPDGIALCDVEGEAVESALAGAPMEGPVHRAGDDLAWLFYTSGTTGRPKGVMLTHLNLQIMSLSYVADVDAVDRRDAALYAAPMSHGAGLYAMIHVRAAARHAVPLSGGFDGEEILDLARRLDRVSMFAAPTMVRRLVAAAKARGETGEGIKTIVYGGGPMYLADIEEALAVMGPRFVQIYGQGEAPMAITALSRALHGARDHPRYRDRLASVGVVQSGCEIRIADEDGRPLPPGLVGEIEARGPLVMAGYWNRPDATAETLRDGWLRTGDMGVMDADGFLTLRDRSKDVIISGGTNIYPREVEEALLDHPAVAEVSVVGVPDPEWGEIVVACWVAEAGAAAEEGALDAHLLERIARFKRPKRYVRLEALPKNNYGKVLKTALRERAGAG